MSNNYKEWIFKKWKKPNEKDKVISLIIIAVLFLVLRFIIYSDSEINSVYIHGINIPVILAGIIFGIKGGIIGGLVAGFMLAPFSPLVFRELGIVSFNNMINWGGTGVFVLTGAVIGISFDLLKINLNKLEKGSLFDSETGLPNKNNLIKDIDNITFSKKSESGYLILIDVENHLDIINVIGHRLSGEFLQQVAKQIQKRVDRNINIYNVYGNKFGILLTISNQKDISSFIDELTKMFKVSFLFNQIPIYLNTHLGIAQISEDNQEKSSVVQDAYIAMNKAKKTENNHLYYENISNKTENNHLILLGELKKEIENDHFLLHYQPKLNLKTGEITGVEALIRWQHPERGLIPPNHFIPQVEKTALINDLTYWVIKKAVEDLLKFKKNLELSMAINIVPRNLKDKEFPIKLEKIITQNNINPQKIELEITETAIMVGLKEGKKVLSDLANKGFKISLDDFGTGYSSLAYLKNLPIDNIKVDRSFVKNILADSKDREIVNSAVQLGHILDKKVIAEGVESKKALDLIKEMGCDVIQGYFLGKPVSFDEFKEIHFG